MTTKKLVLAVLLFTGCAGWDRGCSAWSAERFGSDWLIAQYNYNGEQMHCWKLINRSVSNETQSDGVYWTSSTGHLVHIGGWYTRVQVADGQFRQAAAANNIDLTGCK